MGRRKSYVPAGWASPRRDRGGEVAQMQQGLAAYRATGAEAKPLCWPCSPRRTAGVGRPKTGYACWKWPWR